MKNLNQLQQIVFSRKFTNKKIFQNIKNYELNNWTADGTFAVTWNILLTILNCQQNLPYPHE